MGSKTPVAFVAPETDEWLRADDRAFRPVLDTRRPHVRLGVLWFVVVTLSFAMGPVAVAVPFAATAAVGAAQTAHAWRRRGGHPQLLVAAVVAGVLPVGTAFSSRGAGVVVLLGVGGSVALASGSIPHLLAQAGLTIRCWLFVGVAAASMVGVYRVDVSAAAALFVLVSAFEVGDYLMGSESRWSMVGPLAGMAAVLVLSFSLYVVALPPFGDSDVFVFGAAVAVLAPLGQIVASLLLPDGRAVASGLRRLDSLVLVGPAWLLLLAAYPV